MSTYRIYVPRETSALSLGAEEVVDAILFEAKTRNVSLNIIRNGSWGLTWLEPLVEVDTAKGRIAYGPVSSADVASLFDSEFYSGGNHSLRQGKTTDIPYLKKQERLTFARCGIIDPVHVSVSYIVGATTIDLLKDNNSTVRIGLHI